MTTTEYSVRGRKVKLEVDETVVAVRYAEPALHSMRASIALSANLGPFANRIEVPEEKYTIIPVGPPNLGIGPMTARFSASRAILKKSKDVVRVAPVYRTGNKHMIATERVLLRLRAGTLEKEKKLVEKYKLTIIEAFGDRAYLVQLPEDDDPVEIAVQLSAEPQVDYAEPDFVIFGRHVASRVVPTERQPTPARPTALSPDPLAQEQYALQVTQAFAARKQQTGVRDVRIAILDEGVDTLHPDLKSAIVGAYDAVEDDQWQEPKPWDAHGTACAGLAAAIGDNGEGIVGVGGGCAILAVRIAFSESNGADWTTRESWIRRAIDWSWQNGAAILSNSWGGGPYNATIDDAFERARTQGRGGKGCVIVIAAGNESGAVSFPGNLPNVLTVSASNEFDEFKTKMSKDGETKWGSNFGPEVDVAAPGVHNLTTDIVGGGGYSATDYYRSFNGTSSATPLVAGACGLLLSAALQLKENQVRDAIKATADKVGALPYVGGRNDQMGNGRLNVHNALQYVLTNF